MRDTFRPNLSNPFHRHNNVEKHDSSLRSTTSPRRDDHIPWGAKQMAQSLGICVDYDRAQTGAQSDLLYVVRLVIPGGGPISPQQWALLDDLSRAYTGDPRGRTSLRLTKGQDIQFHWVEPSAVLEIIRCCAQAALLSGDSGQAKIFAIDSRDFHAPVESFRYGPRPHVSSREAFEARREDWIRHEFSESVSDSLVSRITADSSQHGWREQANGLWSYTLHIESGRISDASPRGRLQGMIAAITESFQSPLFLTRNQALLITDVKGHRRQELSRLLLSWAYRKRHSRLCSQGSTSVARMKH